MENIRVRYEKTGRAKYISHLDLMRGMGRALTRAKIPVWYTQGFHPHIYMTFALPLALGYESLCECMDLRLDAPMDYGEVTRRLSDTLPDGLTVTQVYSLDGGAHHERRKPTEIAKATYLISARLSSKGFVPRFAEAFQDFCCSPSIMVEKRTKKGSKQIDLVPDFSVLQPLDPTLAADTTLSFRMDFSAGAHNINPTLLLDAFLASHPDDLAPLFSIRREILRCADGELFA